MKKYLRILFIFIFLIIIWCIINVSLKTPSHERDWVDDLERLSQIRMLSDSEFEIQNLRDWTYDGQTIVSKTWTSDTFDINNLENVWFYKQPFWKWEWVAHTFLVFEFNTWEYLGVSVEARKEKWEEYSGFTWIFNNFELVYQWATEKDLLTRRAVYIWDDIHQYKLNISPEEWIFILKQLIKTTQSIEAWPRFYNTLRHNCTNELAQSINKWEVFPWIPRNISMIFTGFSDKYLTKLGYIENNDPSYTNITPMILNHSQEKHTSFWEKIRVK